MYSCDTIILGCLLLIGDGCSHPERASQQGSADLSRNSSPDWVEQANFGSLSGEAFSFQHFWFCNFLFNELSVEQEDSESLSRFVRASGPPEDRTHGCRLPASPSTYPVIEEQGGPEQGRVFSGRGTGGSWKHDFPGPL